MGDQRDGGISWTDVTWNPTRGCWPVSPGCLNCYAAGVAARFSGPGLPYEGLAKRIKSLPQWTGEGSFVSEHLADPLRWTRPRRVFVDSMSDLFFEKFTDAQIAAVFGVMAAAPRHTFQVLTKRPERAMEWFAWAAEQPTFLHTIPKSPKLICGIAAQDVTGLHWTVEMVKEWPLPNVWMGVSVEDRKHGVPRIDLLRKVPAAVRFLSIEPLLEDVGELDIAGIHWVIVGGESGQGARVCRLEWVESVLEQCRAQGVPVFVKQLGTRPAGEWRGDNAPKYHLTDLTVQPPRESVELNRTKGGVWKLTDRKGGTMSEWPAHLRVREMPEVR